MIMEPGGSPVIFEFRPWVRRAGLSIIIVAGAVTAVLAAALILRPESRYGWIGEGFVWVYVGALWAGGLRVYGGTFRPIAEIREGTLVLRPLHGFRTRTIAWSTIRGTEQTVPGDRLIVYFEGARGMRFVALNLNLVRGRREFTRALDGRLVEMGFVEKVVERSRYLSPIAN